MSFVHLRVHSEYSFLRGACRLDALVARASALGMPALALTDHAVLHGAVRFSELARRYGIQPILGAEFSLRPGLPVVLLVRDDTGWQNLLGLVNKVQLSGCPSAQLTVPVLLQYTEGLSAVVHAYGDDVTLSEKELLPGVAALLEDLHPGFGCDLFLGLENNGLPGSTRFNRKLADEAQKLGIGLLATHNVNYVEAKEDVAYRMLNCIRSGIPLEGSNNSFLRGTGYEIKTQQQMERDFLSFPGACENTLHLAARCSFVLKQGEMHLPAFSPPGGQKAGSYLRRLCLEAMVLEGMDHRSALPRLEHELAVIEKKGLSSYFLIVHDLVSFARRSRIAVGPGRGSAGGSLVAYLLGITRVDPLAHGLYFERFLSEDRCGFPDIDLDVCQRRREELLTYLRSTYGKERVAQVSTFSTLGARAAVREAGKIKDMTSDKISAVAEALPHYTGPGGIEAAVRRYPEFCSPYLRGKAAESVLSSARMLEGYCRHLSTHASGVIIGARDLTQVLPLCRGAAGEVLTQWDKDDVEAQGFLKIDILGSRNLTVIHDTLSMLEKRRGLKLAVENMPQDDRTTFETLQRGESLGCFQLESSGMRRVLRRLAPDCIGDLVHLLSLYRPGPLESGMLESFVARRHGREKVDYLHPALAEHLEDTYGVVLYQEQVMRIAHEIGGFTPGEADSLRREMGRRSPALQGVYRERFVLGARKKGLGKEEADTIFAHLCRFAGYGFNKAHSAAYALVSYWTAYLKAHYPVEFYAALLSSGSGYYGPAVYVQEARARGVAILPPHVNKSGWDFQPEGEAIRASLPLVRELGTRGTATILAARQRGAFTGLADFCSRVGRGTLRRTAICNLVKVGAFDGLGLNRRQVLTVLDDILKWTAGLPGQVSLLELMPLELLTEPPELPDYTIAEAVAAELDKLGMALSGHPLACFGRLQAGRTLLADLKSLPAGRRVTVAGVVMARSRRRAKKGDVMLTMLLADESGLAEVVFFPAAYRRHHRVLSGGALLVTGRTADASDSVTGETAVSLF